jgi:intein-encoded DNA endonuclease-like protein
LKNLDYNRYEFSRRFLQNIGMYLDIRTTSQGGVWVEDASLDCNSYRMFIYHFDVDIVHF